MTRAMSVEEFRAMSGIAPPSPRGPASPKPAKGKVRVKYVSGEMNKTEQRYAAHLRDRVADGEVLWFVFERHKFKLADKTWYSPDFMVQLADGTVEFHDVKGWKSEDDARVKIKVAAEVFPFAYREVRWDAKAKAWQISEPE